MKILITTNTIPDKTGTYVVLKNVIPYLMKNNEVTILTNQCDVDIKCDKLVQLSTSNIFSQYYFTSGLSKLLHDGFFNDFDIIHAFEYPLYTTDFLTLKKSQFNAPLLISPHGSLHEFNSFPLNYLKRIHNYFMLRYKNNVSNYTACSMAEKKHLIEYGIDKNKILTLPLGVISLKLDFTKRVGKNITYIGRLTKTKNVELLIKAFAQLHNTDANLTIAGPDYGELSMLKNLVQKLKIENKVIFTGWISEKEKIDLLSKTSIFVHPSLEDIFSLSLAETSASGVPVIAFGGTGTSEIITDMVTGKIVKERNLESLRDAMDYILSNPDLIKKFSENGRVLTTKKYNWLQTASDLENLYSSLT
jgi:glycosyltransferase involved in cell wall biosynthesis